MAECEINLFLDGQKHTFNSNEELDGWLWDNRGKIYAKKGDPTLSVGISTQAQRETLGRIGELESIHKAITSNSINKRSTTYTYWTEAQKVVGSGRGYASPTNTFTTEEPDAFGKFKIGMGNEFEAAFWKVLGNAPTSRHRYKILKSTDAQSKMEAIARSVLNYLKSIHGKNAYFRMSVPVGSIEIGTEFKEALRIGNWKRHEKAIKFQGTQGDAKNINAFTGEIDLLVVDEAGIAHIYDFKASARDLSIDTDEPYALQIGIYRQMVRQSSVNTGKVGLLPIHMAYTSKFDPTKGEENIDWEHTVFDSKWAKEKCELSETHESSRKAMNWFPSEPNVEFSEMSGLKKVVDTCMPGSGLETQTKFREAELEEEMKNHVWPVKEEHPKYKEGMRWEYQRQGILEAGEESYIYASTKEELSKKVEKWLETYNARKIVTYQTFAKSLKGIMKTGDISDLRRIAGDMNHSDTRYIVNAFRRYLNRNWNLISNELMVANGIFLFQHNDMLELVMLDTHNPFTRFHWDHGKTRRSFTSIFGHFLDDTQVDNRFQLQNFYGNLTMMKGLIFLSQHPELFKSARLNKVSALSLNSNAYLEESNEKLIENFRLMAKEYQNATGERLGILTIGKNVNSDAVAYVNTAMDILEDYSDKVSASEDPLNEKAFKDMEDKANYSSDQIMRMIRALRHATNEGLYTAKASSWESETRQALDYLNRAYLTSLGKHISPEGRVGTYTNGGVDISGLWARPASRSRSAIARTMHEAYYSFVRVCQNEYVRYTNPWKKLIEKLYVENGHDKTWGGEWDFFTRFFETDNDGKLDSRFRLKRIEQVSTPTEKAVLKAFYDAIDRFKYGLGTGNDRIAMEKIEAAKTNGSYYEVPLVKSHFNEKSSKIGALKAALEVAKTDWNVMRDLLLNVDVSDKVVHDLNDIDISIIPAYILADDPKREEKLHDNTVNNYTTDLDFIYNLIVQQGIRQEYSPRMMMIASAMRARISYMQWMGAKDMDNIAKFMDEYVKNKLLSRPIIDPSQTSWANAINMIKGMVSVAVLGVNPKAFTRETITGFYNGFKNVSLHPQLKSKIDIKYYKEAVEEVIQNAYKNTDVMSWHMQLNQLYGTANFSYNQMAEASKVNQYGLKNLTTSDVFFTATWPDFIHRNAIIIAHLKTIGAYNAYSIVDGLLTYDMDKDPRFEMLRKYKKRSDVPTGLINQWNKAWNLYEDGFKSWKYAGYKHANGEEFKLGDKLPQALSPREVSGLKDIADAMYGNYDQETKSLMTAKLLGSLFLQFRTYGINRLQQFLDGYTDTSDIRMVQQKIKNANNELEDAFIVFSSDNDMLNGTDPFAQLKPRSEVDLEDIKSGKAVEYRMPESYTTAGFIQSTIDTGVTLFVYRNQEEFEKMWKDNPMYRANLSIFMLDTFGMLLLAILINALYGESMQGDYNDIDWTTKWTYNVAMGVAQDGPIWSVLSSVAGDGAPPMLSALKNYANNAWSVITGKQNFLYGIANSIGATRELAYLFHSK